MGKKLLLADDSITIQKVIQITFAHEDYELTVTDNGDAALTKALEIKPDLVMTDVYMPGKNGYELTSAIKQDPALQHIPVLLLAGSFEPFDEDKARSCKADAWIEKPFESQNLIDKVAELLSAAPAASEAPVASAAPAAVSEPEPAAEVAPAVEVAVEETPLAVFDEPDTSVPEAPAASEDPFGDISFEEEVPAVEAAPEPVAEPEPVAAADDWADVAAEPVAEEAFTVAEAPVTEETFAVAEAPVEDVIEDFSFAEEEPVAAEDLTVAEEVPVAEADLDVFDMGEDEIMPLGDDDILGEEDLEPAMPEQTLAAWSRTDADTSEDVFADPLEETPVVQDEPVFEAATEPVFTEETPAFAEAEPAFVEEEPAAIETPVFEQPEATPTAIEEPVPTVEETEPAAVAATMVDVEAKAAAISEEELEQIIEKVVTKVVEKLAGSILERVAWDVVPDLAENLIREEIRKIKDAAA